MAIIGIGATIKWGWATPTNAISDVTSVMAPAAEFSEAETTNLSVTDSFKTFIPTLADGGNVSFECNYSKAQVAALYAILGKFDNGTAKMTWEIGAPDEDGAGAGTAQKFTFQGFLKKLEPATFTPEGVAKLKGDIRVVGAITLS